MRRKAGPSADENAKAIINRVEAYEDEQGTHPRWQIVENDGSGAPKLTDMGARFGIVTGAVLTLFTVAPPNGSSV